MIIFVILIFGLIFMTLLGYVTHKAFHQPWSGIFFRAHTDHHNKQYPSSNMVSEVYRSSGNNNTTYYFAAIFSPLIIGNILLTIFGIISIFLGIGIFIEMGIVSYFNIILHDSFHLKNSFWHRFWFFDRLVKLHTIHHLDQQKNFSIFGLFIWDKIFNTYEEE
jgi:sterol desaturase/sphingolipid hydroxylase (fatty acid hydroxylase superfamily)